MPARRVAEPYLINERGGVREVVCHRYVKGGVHRRPRQARSSLLAYAVMILLASLPLIAVMTLPANSLPQPFPFFQREDVPGGRTGRTGPAAPAVPPTPNGRTAVPIPRPSASTRKATPTEPPAPTRIPPTPVPSTSSESPSPSVEPTEPPHADPLAGFPPEGILP